MSNETGPQLSRTELALLEKHYNERAERLIRSANLLADTANRCDENEIAKEALRLGQKLLKQEVENLTSAQQPESAH